MEEEVGPFVALFSNRNRKRNHANVTCESQDKPTKRIELRRAAEEQGVQVQLPSLPLPQHRSVVHGNQGEQKEHAHEEGHARARPGIRSVRRAGIEYEEHEHEDAEVHIPREERDRELLAGLEGVGNGARGDDVDQHEGRQAKEQHEHDDRLQEVASRVRIRFAIVVRVEHGVQHVQERLGEPSDGAVARRGEVLHGHRDQGGGEEGEADHAEEIRGSDGVHAGLRVPLRVAR
eukprot:scaffold1541_cov256-Pinguiococcus_pyrenoidosus.AAC.5